MPGQTLVRTIFGIEHGVQRRVVVHLHLFVDLHVLASRSDVVEELLDGLRQIDLLGLQHLQLLAAGGAVVVVDVRADRFAVHVVDLERQDREAVDGPGGGLGVDAGVGLRGHLAVFLQHIGVDVLHHVGTDLIRLVDPAFEGQRRNGIDLRIADDILQVPLHGVDPALLVEQEVDAAVRIGVVHGVVHIVETVIVVDHLTENPVRIFGKHIQSLLSVYNCKFR